MKDPSGVAGPFETERAPSSSGRLAYLDEIAPLLWPSPESVARRRSLGGSHHRSDVRQYALVPPGRDPRLVVPLGSRTEVASIIRRWGSDGGAGRRVIGRGLAWLTRAGAGWLVLPDRVVVSGAAEATALEEHLSEIVGQQVSITIQLTRPRANRKPVLGLVAADGTPVAFVKVGTTGLPAELVNAETRALHELDEAAITSMTCPSLIHSGEWHGLTLLVLSPLRIHEATEDIESAQLVGAMKEVAAVGGLTRERWPDSAYRKVLTARVSTLEGEVGARLQGAFVDVERAAGIRDLTFGSWHGDWARWNCAMSRSALLVWDWERFGGPVPLGFDLAHFEVHRTLLDPALDTRALTLDYPAALRPLLIEMGVPVEETDLTTLLYLFEIAVRYVGDRQHEVGNLRHVIDSMVTGIVEIASAQAASVVIS